MGALEFFECILIFTTATSFKHNEDEIVEQLDFTIKICKSKVRSEVRFKARSKVGFEVRFEVGSEVGSKVRSDVG